MAKCLLLLAVLILTASTALAQSATSQSAPAARLDKWKVIGPGGGGTTVAPVISPHDSKLAVLHCDMTGAYITHDGGQSWRMFNLGSGVSTFAFDPKNPDVIYAGNNALWKSDDRGKTWKMLLPDPTKNTAVHMRGDHSSFDLTTDDKNYPAGYEPNISAIAIGPDDSKKIHIVMSGQLMVSADGGGTWKSLHKFDDQKVFLIQPVPGSGKIVVAGSSAVYTVDGDKVSSSEPELSLEPPPRFSAAASGMDGKGGVSVWYVVGGELFRFRLSEGKWQMVLGAKWPFGKGASAIAGAVACCQDNADVCYVGYANLQDGETALRGVNGIAKTTDGGKTWELVTKDGATGSPNIEKTWIDLRCEENIKLRGGPDHNVTFVAPYSLAVAPNDPNVCIATDLFRTYTTRDGGKTWKDVSSAKVGQNTWTTTGLDVTTNYGVHFDPFDKDHLMMSYTDIGLQHSFDGGKSWAGSVEGIPLNWRNTCYWVEFDPKVRGRAWAVWSFVHDLPRPKMWRNRDVSKTYEGGVAVTNDGGKTWKLSNKDMKPTAATHILLDPTSPPDKRTLYVCGYGTGVWKSTDNGESWQQRNKGLDYAEPFAWRLTRADDGTLYLVVARRKETIGPDDAKLSGAIFRSTDAAESWQKMTLPENCSGPNGLTLDPRDNKRMYLSAWGIERGDKPDIGGGIFLSEDAGKTWKSVLADDQHIYDVTVDPKTPDTLYACGFDSSAYRSTDAGKTWARLGGYNFKWGHRVIPDIHNPGMIYITTFGGSVWYGPAAGDAAAKEDWQPKLPKKP